MPMPDSQPSRGSEPNSGCLSGLARLIWMFGGAGLVFCGMSIATRKGAIAADVVMFVWALVLIVVRFLNMPISSRIR